MTLKVKTEKPETSIKNLKIQLTKFTQLLDNVGEKEASADLRTATKNLTIAPLSANQGPLEQIIEAFDGDHELNAYTLRRSRTDTAEWTEAEELYVVSTRVLNLAKRILKSIA